jgi:thiamine biosynthesis lipoprotein ApbE
MVTIQEQVPTQMMRKIMVIVSHQCQKQLRARVPTSMLMITSVFTESGKETTSKNHSLLVVQKTRRLRLVTVNLSSTSSEPCKKSKKKESEEKERKFMIRRLDGLERAVPDPNNEISRINRTMLHRTKKTSP